MNTQIIDHLPRTHSQRIVVGRRDLGFQVDVVAFHTLNGWSKLFDELWDLKKKDSEDSIQKTYLLWKFWNFLWRWLWRLDLLNPSVASRVLDGSENGVFR